MYKWFQMIHSILYGYSVLEWPRTVNKEKISGILFKASKEKNFDLSFKGIIYSEFGEVCRTWN